ncbi:MAG: hypothetical protein N2738_07725 [Thermodesulfovibrionales bacterium]|nr:hypothetical protein [Thermodesulfovibrionales bacterium]
MSTTFSLSSEIASIIVPFASEVQDFYGEKIHSFYIVGSALTSDYNKKNSDINTLLVLREIALTDIENLWNFGKKHHKKGISAPICMTPEYIFQSIDVFPIEFHDFKLIHLCIKGDDLLSNLEINKEHLRLQCEREIKSRLLNLRQSYLTSLGDDKIINNLLINSVNGTAPLFRAILNLLDLPIPLSKADVFKAIQDYMDYKGDLFTKMLSLKEGKTKLSKHETKQLIYDFYDYIERLGNILNTI